MTHTQSVFSRSAALASGALIVGALLMIGFQAAPASASEGACSDGSGVTVVVDATDIGGGVVTGCATGDPATGRDALEAAGFVATDSQPGMICAINAQPDPCPATFEGSYWSYWSATTDGDWTSYQVGADSSDPAQGAIEGWRYNDGSVGPGIAPADVAGAQIQASSSTTSEATSSSTASDAGSNIVLYTAIGLAVVLAVLAAVFVLRSRSRRVIEED